MKPMLWMLTGKSGSGKSTFCRHLAGLVKDAGLEAAGLISPAVLESGIKTGILAEDLHSGETRQLASAVQHPPYDLQLGNWFFDRSSLTWGDHVLRTTGACDVLIVDELGPIEFTHGKGWHSALELLRKENYRIGVVVIRPELQQAARQRLPIRGEILLGSQVVNKKDVRTWWRHQAVR